MIKEYIQNLSKEELGYLKDLIGKQIILQSDNIILNTSAPILYTFYESIEIRVSNDPNTYVLRYIYSEKKDDDFITLVITKKIASKVNKSVVLCITPSFTISRIEVYGYSNEVDIDPDLKEITSEENVILIHSTDGRMICIECLYIFLDVRVTLDEELILLALTKPNYQGKILLKHTI